MNTIRLNTIGTPKASGGNSGGNGGGGNTPSAQVAVNDVTFYDYDGTILHSYSKDEFLKMSAFPPLPTQAGLICQEWNWSFEDAKVYVSAYGVLDVGATYITDDGKSRFYIEIPYDGMALPWYFYVSGNVVIDWGDGQQSTFTTNKLPETHTYEKKGKYVVVLDAVNGIFTLGNADAGSGIIGRSDRVMSSVIYKAELGINVYLGKYENEYGGFCGCSYLQTVNLPSHIDILPTNVFDNCANLQSIVFPKNVKGLKSQMIGCQNLDVLVLPRNFTEIGNILVRSKRLILPENITGFHSPTSIVSLAANFICAPNINNVAFRENQCLKNILFTTIGKVWNWNQFYGCKSLETVSLEDVGTIPNYAFYDCHSLRFLIMPKSVTQISDYAFYNCHSLQYIDFSEHESVPVLANYSVFSGVSSSCKIVVPDVLYEEWIAATNWSSHARKIVKASEFND